MNRRDEAIEALAEWLKEDEELAIRGARSRSVDLSVAKERALAMLLSVTDATGLPYFAVVHENQEPPKLSATTYHPMGYFVGAGDKQDAMLQAGFRKVYTED